MLIELEGALLAIAGLIVGVLILVRHQVLRQAAPIYRSAAIGSATGFLFCAYHVFANHAGGGAGSRLFVADQCHVIGLSLIMAALGVQALKLNLPKPRLSSRPRSSARSGPAEANGQSPTRALQ
jgi:hypothetical protein